MKRSDDTENNDVLVKLMEEINASTLDVDSLCVSMTLMEYPKFRPKNLINRMAAIERNSTICARDARFLVKYYLHLTSETRLCVTSEGHEKSQKLMKKYRVEKKAHGDNITLHRIAAAFPILGVNLLRHHKIERKFSSVMLQAKNARDFPWCMRTQMCLSLAPMEPEFVQDPEYRRLIFSIIAFMYYENKIVTENKMVVMPTEIFEKVLNIAHTVYNDSLIDSEKKKHAWNHVMFDYIANKRSVDNLLMSFRMEIPEAEPAFLNRFNFIDVNKNKVWKTPKGRAAKGKK